MHAPKHATRWLTALADALLADDIFMNNFTETTWMGVVMGEELLPLNRHGPQPN